MGYVYVITLDDKPVYVGMTSRHYKKRFAGHVIAAEEGDSLPIHRAIAKYGLDRMKCVPQLRCDDVDTLFDYEKYLIKVLDTQVPAGYNLSEGGEGNLGYRFTDEQRSHLSNIRRGVAHTEAHNESIKESLQELGSIGELSNPGSSNGNSLLTEEQVLEIRHKYTFKLMTYKELAREYGVCGDTIRNIVTRRSWTHI